MTYGHTIGQHFEVRVLNGAEITDPPRLDGPRFDPCPEGSYCIFLGGIFNLNEDPTPPQGPELSWRSYYFAGGRRIAMREVNALGDPFGTVTWLLGDHLGSTSLSVSESGGVLAEAKYTPWGDQRTLAGDLPTDYGYTDQREESALGLMYYVARWYDSGIGHFVQADTVVPGAGNPAAYNRYAYVMYNPVKYVDPSGHGNELPWDDVDIEVIKQLMHTPTLADYDVTTVGWSPSDEQAILDQIVLLSKSLLSACTSAACRNLNMYSIFKHIFGPITIQRVDTYTTGDGKIIDPGEKWICYSSLLCVGKSAYGKLGNFSQEGLIIHELAHVILNTLGLHDITEQASLGYYENGEYVHVSGINQQGQYERTNEGYAGSGRPYQQHDSSFDDWISSPLEDHADMMMNWALVGFDDNIAGNLRMDYMNNFMEAAMNGYFGGQ